MASSLGVNRLRLQKSDDEAYDLIVAVAAGDLDEGHDIAEVLRQRTEPPRPKRMTRVCL